MIDPDPFINAINKEPTYATKSVVCLEQYGNWTHERTNKKFALGAVVFALLAIGEQINFLNTDMRR